MGYVWKEFGSENLNNLDSGPTDVDLSLINVKNSSTTSRLELEVNDEIGHWDVVALGTFDLRSATTVSGIASANVTTLLTWLDGIPGGSNEYTPGYDLIQWMTNYDYRYTLLSDADEFVGSPDNPVWGDQVLGGSGNDRFTGYKDGVGSDGKVYYDSFFGESGIDTAHYRGQFSEYLITQDAMIWDARYKTQTQGTSVVDNISGRDGTDWLKEVERLEFSDTNLALDIGKGEIAGSAYRIYKAAFDRTPDSGGLGFWINAMDDGASLTSVAAGFINSPEFQQLYGANVTDRDFVTKVYTNVLDRNPDQSGYDFWLGAMGRGATRADILTSFSESDENIANVADLIANGILYQEWLG